MAELEEEALGWKEGFGTNPPKLPQGVRRRGSAPPLPSALPPWPAAVSEVGSFHPEFCFYFLTQTFCRPLTASLFMGVGRRGGGGAKIMDSASLIEPAGRCQRTPEKVLLFFSLLLQLPL